MHISIFVLGICCIFDTGFGASNNVLYAAAPEERGAFHVGGKGVYNYGYNTGDGIAKVEVGRPDGSVIGSYRYFDPLGRQIVRSYIADNRGFRVLGNELPVAPDTPALGILNAQTLTGSVEGTQEFSSPNIVTKDETLIFQNQLGYHTNLGSPVDVPKKESENVPSQFQQQLIQKHNDIIKQQEELIKRQEKQLAKLKSQQEELLKQQRQYIEQLQQPLKTESRQSSFDYKQTQPNQPAQSTDGGYFSFLNDAFGRSSHYLVGDGRNDYDFPAGFTYNVNQVRDTGEDTRIRLTSRNYGRQSYKPPYTIGYRLN